ncbi:MAG: alpha/beta hydrolase [Deltaproteobacteria bacterium]|nr:alpha/beta hydrolase [Deltaproteobacteria bacterium]
MGELKLDEKYKDFEDKYANVNGVNLHFPEFWYLWKDQLVEFGKDHQAVALDMRGYNLSSKPEELDQYRVDVLVEDLRALAESLGNKKFILVAHDWGGVVAWPFAISHPDWLEKLVIINAPHPGVFGRLLVKNRDQQSSSQYIRMFRTPEAEKILSANNYAGLLDVIQTDATNFSETDKQMYINAWSQSGALTGGLNYYRASPFEPPAVGDEAGDQASKFADSVKRESFMVKVPTLVIWGELDTALTVHNLDGLDEFVPDLTIKRIPEGSHWVINEQPERINALIREFIT